ncbi:MAG: hypothetical protein ACO1N2_02715 [Candidatus Saccharimonadota bacterium]|jgi:hypothetical protein
MFGYNIKKFAFNWAIILLVLAIGASATLGYDSITNTFDPFAGFVGLGDLFGGLPTLGGILVVVLAVLAVLWLLFYMTNNDYTGKGGLQAFHIGIIVVVIVVAAVLGLRWIEFTDEFWPTVGTLVAILAVVTVATALVTHRIKTPATPAAVTTTTP